MTYRLSYSNADLIFEWNKRDASQFGGGLPSSIVNTVTGVPIALAGVLTKVDLPETTDSPPIPALSYVVQTTNVAQHIAFFEILGLPTPMEKRYVIEVRMGPSDNGSFGQGHRTDPQVCPIYKDDTHNFRYGRLSGNPPVWSLYGSNGQVSVNSVQVSLPVHPTSIDNNDEGMVVRVATSWRESTGANDPGGTLHFMQEDGANVQTKLNAATWSAAPAPGTAWSTGWRSGTEANRPHLAFQSGPAVLTNDDHENRGYITDLRIYEMRNWL